MSAKRQAIKILLADDRVILRTGLRTLLAREVDFQIVGEAANGQEAIQLVSETGPHVLLIDLWLPGLSASEVVRRISGQHPKVRTLVMAAIEDETEIFEAFRHGARGVVLKDADSGILIQGIRTVMGGKFWLRNKPAIRLGKGMSRLAELYKEETRQKNFGLTSRETEIIAAIVSGYSNKEIAEKFAISEDTVKHHLTNIFDKAGVYNRLELALFAIHIGLVGKS